MLAKKLDHRDDLESILIDEKEYFEYYPSLPKLITDPDLHADITKSYSDFLMDTEIISEKVEKITPEKVSTGDREVGFDILVVSLGAEYPVYLEDDENVFTISSGEEVKELSVQVSKADKILVVGGGLIGTETAAELASKTEKEVVLVHSHERLIERNPGMASYFAEKYLESKGVNLRFDEKVVSREGDTFKTDSGEKIEADVCIWSTGLDYDDSLFRGFEGSCFTESGALKVNDHLQLKGHPNVFVGGDITDIDEEKTGHNADAHSKVIFENIVRTREGRALKKYSRSEVALVISLGDINGLLSFTPVAVPGPVPALIKHVLEKGALLRL